MLLVSGDQLAPGARTITWAEAAQLPLALLMPHMRFRQFIDKAFASQRRLASPSGRNRFGRFPLLTCGDRRLGERGAPHVAARDPRDARRRAVRLVEPETTAQISIAIHAAPPVRWPPGRS